MPRQWLDLKGPVTADTVYVNQRHVGNDMKVTLPQVANQSNDFENMGTWTLPVINRFEHMEFSITKTGVDETLQYLLEQDFLDFNVNWTQDVKDDTGAHVEGCKAFLHCIPMQGLPQMALEPGAVTELEIPYSVDRYELFANGTRILLIDRRKGIYECFGKDYTAQQNALL